MKFKEDVRFKILRKLRSLSGCREGEIAPKWLKFIYYILFPLNWFYERKSHIKYDHLTDVYTIDGMKFTREVFRVLKDEASIGRVFQIVDIKDGITTIKSVSHGRKNGKTETISDFLR